MNYKEAINRFKTLYRIHSLNSEQKELALGDSEILMLLSIPYAHLCNKHKLVHKYSTDNSTPQTNLVAGQSTYTSGTGAENIPNDIRDIYSITLNDTQKTELDRLNTSDISSFTIGSGIPSGYTIDKTTKILVLNASPTSSYASDNGMRLIIHYMAKIWTYSGTAENSFSNVDFTAANFGGSFLNPSEWDDCIIFYALGQLIPGKTQEAAQMEKDLLASNPSYYDYSLPTYLGIYEEYNDSDIPGQDTGRG